MACLSLGITWYYALSMHKPLTRNHAKVHLQHNNKQGAGMCGPQALQQMCTYLSAAMVNFQQLAGKHMNTRQRALSVLAASHSSYFASRRNLFMECPWEG